MKKQPQTSLFSELIVDNFAGGGGASTGIELAVGRPVDIAINHDPDAILMHKTNHPYTRHYQASVWDIDPVEVCRGQRVGLAWFSPDCKHFSKAKGGKPVDKNIRGLAWIVLRWAARVRPRVIILENVEEFQTWGPVRRGRPVKSKAGQTFRKWMSQLSALGYEIEHRELRACDYGAPTIRNRFFLIARCDGKPIVWPEPTHGDPDSPEVRAGKLKPWRAVAEVIDWSLPCPSIFASKNEIHTRYGLKAQRPLADNTLKRVARGVKKFVIDSPRPFIIDCNHGGGFRGQKVERPLQTVTGKHGYGIVSPLLAVNTDHNTGSGPEEPLKTITTGGHHMLVTPVMTAIGQTGFSEDRSYGVAEPMRTVVSKAEQCLVTPALIQYHSEQSGRELRGQAADKPLLTVDAAPRYGVMAPTLTKYYGQGTGQRADEPAHTVTSKDREGLTVAYMSKYYAGGYHGAGNSPDAPLNTVTAADHNAVALAHVVKFKGDDLGQHPGGPLHTITTSAGEFGTVVTYIRKASPESDFGRWPQVRNLLNRYCGYSMADDEVLILRIGGVEWFISDIGLRMLTPRELYAASGFPSDYIIERDYLGHVYGKTKQVARCGNAVPPPFAYALVTANLPELCVRHCRSMAELSDTIAV